MKKKYFIFGALILGILIAVEVYLIVVFSDTMNWSIYYMEIFHEQGENLFADVYFGDIVKSIISFSIYTILDLAAMFFTVMFMLHTLSPKFRAWEERTKEQRKQLKEEKKAKLEERQSMEAEAIRQREIEDRQREIERRRKAVEELEKDLEELKKDGK